jgi:hypothetical protein
MDKFFLNRWSSICVGNARDGQGNDMTSAVDELAAAIYGEIP